MENRSDKPVALVTGVGRGQGLGLEIARQLAAKGFIAIVTAREIAKAEPFAADLRASGLDAVAAKLDMTLANDCFELASWVSSRFGRLDALVNNAAIGWDFQTATLEAPLSDVAAAFDTNVLGPWRLTVALLPLLRTSPSPCVVNVSSEAASFTAANGMAARGPTLGGYSVTKAALNALTVKLATALGDSPVRVNSVCPGWVATFPGTAEMSARPVPDGARGVVWAATLPPDGPTGGFFRDAQPLGW